MYINNSVVENNNHEMILDELENEKPTNRSVTGMSNGNNSVNMGQGNYSLMNVSNGGVNNSSLNNTMNFIRCIFLSYSVQNQLIKEEGG